MLAGYGLVGNRRTVVIGVIDGNEVQLLETTDGNAALELQRSIAARL